MVSTSSTLERLADWYLRHCDGDWEHGFGFKIETIDNPGIALKVNLEGAPNFTKCLSPRLRTIMTQKTIGSSVEEQTQCSRRLVLLRVSKTLYVHSSIGQMHTEPSN